MLRVRDRRGAGRRRASPARGTAPGRPRPSLDRPGPAHAGPGSRPCRAAPPGTNGIGGQGMTLAIVESSSGAAVGRRDEPGDRVRRRGQEQHAADDLGQRVEPELEPRHDAEVAAAARGSPRTGPGSCVVVDHVDRAVGRHDLGGEQAVDREPVLADEVADAAARRDPAEARPSRCRRSRSRGRARPRRSCRPRRSARCRPRRSSPSSSISRPSRSRTSSTMPPSTVPWAAPLWPPERTASSRPCSRARAMTVRDVVGVGDPHDQRGPGVDAAEHDGPCLVVVGVAGGDHAPVDAAADVLGIDARRAR